MKYYIFADESNISKARFMLIGGIWVDELTYQAVRQECINFKADNNWESLTKLNWKNVSKQTLPQYKKFIDIFFKYNLNFRCIILDRKTVNLRLNEEQDQELGFYKFYYMLLRNCSEKGHQYYIYLDRRNNRCPNRLQDMQMYLEKSRLRRTKEGDFYYQKGLDVKTIEFVNSNSYDLIQFADLILGAIGYHYNERHLKPDASPHKCALAEYIAEKIKKSNLVFETDKEGYKNFNLWKFKSYKELNNDKEVNIPT